MIRGKGLILLVGGAVVSAPSAALALGAASLAAVSIEAEAAGGTDTLVIRAFNGLSWGDWQGIVIDAPPAVALAEPVTLSFSRPADAAILHVVWHGAATSHA